MNPSEWLEQHGPSALGRPAAEVRGQLAIVGLLVREVPAGSGAHPVLQRRVTLIVDALDHVVALQVG